MTLIETVLAFTLVSLGLLAAVSLLNTSFLLSASSRHNNQGEQLLQEIMEFYSQDYVHGYGDTTYQLEPVVGADQVTYQREFALSTFSTSLGAPVRRLEATVSWQWKGQPKDKTRVKLVCRPGR
ncbi:hypothetical protein JST97_37410 [bacterium]|nr:hypothetical protein [bacterium]